jgi:hypothetical protein
VLQITSQELERAQSELADLEVVALPGPAAVLELPEAVDQAELLFVELERLSDPDRYERLLELEAQGYLLPRIQKAWQRYFEETEQFARQRDYFEERRAMLAVFNMSQGERQ